MPVNVEASPLFPLPPGVFYHDHDNGMLYYNLAPNQTAADLEADAIVREFVENSLHVADLVEAWAFLGRLRACDEHCS